MRFGVLDIARDSAEQGFAHGGFDVVLAYNVVHATPRIDDTLGNLCRMLAPGGTLILVETTRLRRWDDHGVGPDRGMVALHRPASAHGIAAARPRRLAGRAATRGVRVGDGARRRTRRATSHCSSPSDRPRPAAEENPARATAALATITDIRAAGGEAHVIRADIADAAQMRAALAEAHDRIGPLHGVIHTAGTLGQGLIHGMTPEAAAAGLRLPRPRACWCSTGCSSSAESNRISWCSARASPRWRRSRVRSPTAPPTRSSMRSPPSDRVPAACRRARSTGASGRNSA